MINRPHEVTARVVIEFSRNMLRDLATYYGGGCTLNELRVMNQVILCSHEGRRCGVTALHNVTGIPIPTVSRAVTNLQKDGWLSSQLDPYDGRKRIISLGPRSLAGTWDAIDKKIQWINEFRDHGLRGHRGLPLSKTPGSRPDKGGGRRRISNHNDTPPPSAASESLRC